MRHVNSGVEKTLLFRSGSASTTQLPGLELSPSLKRNQGTIGGAAGDADGEAARERAEAARRERSKVIALNKLVITAQAVRREFVKDRLWARWRLSHSKDAWRSSTGAGVGHYVGPAAHLKWLADKGYELSATEQVITGKRRADAVYDDTLRKEDSAA
jgi:hypothetical protein